MMLQKSLVEDQSIDFVDSNKLVPIIKICHKPVKQLTNDPHGLEFGL